MALAARGQEETADVFDMRPMKNAPTQPVSGKSEQLLGRLGSARIWQPGNHD